MQYQLRIFACVHLGFPTRNWQMHDDIGIIILWHSKRNLQRHYIHTTQSSNAYSIKYIVKSKSWKNKATKHHLSWRREYYHDVTMRENASIVWTLFKTCSFGFRYFYTKISWRKIILAVTLRHTTFDRSSPGKIARPHCIVQEVIGRAHCATWHLALALVWKFLVLEVDSRKSGITETKYQGMSGYRDRVCIH